MEFPEERETIEILRVGKGKSGFSLLELIIVLLLLGLSSLIVLPSMDRGLKDLEIRRSALRLAAVARDLRSQAIYKGTFQGLILDPSENSYQVLRGAKVRLPSSNKVSAIEGGEPVGKGMRQFHFFPNGSTLGGGIEISGRKGSTSYVIRFDPLSGKVTVVKGNRQ